MSIVGQILEIVLHLDAHLNALVESLGPWIYVLMFAVIFCETGLVVTPFLPGDSLLFALGALAAVDGSPLSLPFLGVLLIAAAVLGDGVNYWVGYLAGPRIFHYDESEKSRRLSFLLNRRHLARTHEFYERHGAKTIVLARFVPIVRTFAPFVAGIAKMGYTRFWQFNVFGGVAWVLLFLVGGYFFGNIPVIKTNFPFVILGIVFVSVLPMVVDWFLTRRRMALAAAASKGAQESVEVEL